MLGTIKISNGKLLIIDHLIIAPKKYLNQLPKTWNVKGLLIRDNNVIKMAQPLPSTKYIFLNALDKGCTFSTEYYPNSVLLRNG